MNTTLDNTILRGEVGSTAHGTGLEGQEDLDHMGVFIEPPENVCGLFPLDHYVFRTAEKDQRSGPGDLDLTLYSLRKFCRLAVKGNPSVIMLLWLDPSLYTVCDDYGHSLIDIREKLISKDAGQAYLGYLIAQRKKMTGERSKKVSRPELVEQFGYDTKFAMHALRLGFQGIEYLTERRLTIPVPEPERLTLLAIRRGELSLEDVLAMISVLEVRLRLLVDRCPDKVDTVTINKFLVNLHMRYWDYNRGRW